MSGLRGALERISEGAAGRDAAPAFPREPLRLLAGLGVLALPVPDPVSSAGRRASFAEEWRVLRAVSRADGSVGRILDGHLNGAERLAALAPEPLRSGEIAAVAAGELVLGVWGADPIPGEGEPARLVKTAGGLAIEGVKTFCSGAGGVDRALVNVRPPGGEGPPLLAYTDLSAGVEVDRRWFRGAGLRSSESHRVIFRGAPVLALLGEPGELTREPYFSRDAVRTAVTWAGMADRAVDCALGVLAAKHAGREPGEVVSLAAGRIVTAQRTADRWLEYAARRADERPEETMLPFAASLREAVAAACRTILDEAARACGSHPFATGADLDRARRDLELFLLQHRLEPALAREGRRRILERRQGEGR